RGAAALARVPDVAGPVGLAAHAPGPELPYGIDGPGLTRWAEELAARVERETKPVDAAACAPVLCGEPRPQPPEGRTAD
ncbi:hypothetical protein P8605_29010, partial [Streptomyces sp. T-3]|nr:hypothetical protein [Streptomyces sp. T-3]